MASQLDYSQAREALREAELDLMRNREAVAELRRQLPPDPRPVDYQFTEGPSDLAAGDKPQTTINVSDLFDRPDQPLLIYHFMLGKAQTEPCPMCTLWSDGFNAIAEHLAQHANFAIAIAGPVEEIRSHARSRGWTKLRLLSCGDNTFKADYDSEDPDGSQHPAISVFARNDDAVDHIYSSGIQLSPTVYERGLDLLNPLWHLMDLTPAGRDGWYPRLTY